MNFRVRGPSGQATLSGVDGEITVAQFQALLHEKIGVHPAHQEILASFPPKLLTLPEDRDSTPVSALGLQSGDNITVREVPASAGGQTTQPSAVQQQQQQQQQQHADGFSIPEMDEDEQLARAIAASLGQEMPPSTAPPPPAAATVAVATTPATGRIATLSSSSSAPSSLFEAIGDGTAIARRVVADDNSCLFSAVGYIMRGTRAAAPLLRSMVAEAVMSDPFQWNEVVLGKDPIEYASWIQDPQKWGGAIELSILSSKFGKEIAAFDIQTERVDVYGQGSGYTERVLVVYDGLHYDALAVATSIGASEDKDVTNIPASGPRTDAVMAAAAKLVAKFHANRQFTDTANFTLRCGICGIGLKGEKEALQHAKSTGHANFSEY